MNKVTIFTHTSYYWFCPKCKEANERWDSEATVVHCIYCGEYCEVDEDE